VTGLQGRCESSSRVLLERGSRKGDGSNFDCVCAVADSDIEVYSNEVQGTGMKLYGVNPEMVLFRPRMGTTLKTTGRPPVSLYAKRLVTGGLIKLL
jgi:hypothetical protein